MNLILVESPTKAKTLGRFLGKSYRVEATMGHIRDLPKSTLGVDVEKDFTPDYIIPTDKKKRVSELVAAAKEADSIILASDPDREGEAIAWHVAQILTEKGIGKKAAIPFSRITFHEITKSAIDDALAHPGKIDTRLVDAQQARRVLDRLVGYKLSPLLWQKMSKRWLSAGRVQSVAVRLVVEREREIKAFAKEPYFTIEGLFSTGGPAKETITAGLVSYNGEKYERELSFPLFDGTYTTKKTTIPSEDEAKKIVVSMASPWKVSAVETKQIKRQPPAPYTTSTLQQDGGRKLYFSSKKIMQLAQKLYEEGLITYHRTDSVNLAQKFISEVRSYCKTTFGPSYIPGDPRTFHTKSKVAQEAHEAIRPTDVARLAETLTESPEFNHDHVRLYELIWKRAVACQMAEARFDSTTITIHSSNGYQFACQGSVITFDGYLRVAGHENGETILPAVTVGQTVERIDMKIVPHETTPPPRYSEASLVKTLEEKDIGRPSTYAPIISTILERQYVKKEDKKLFATELGEAVTDFLVKYFPDIMSLPFTATMENSLDAIAGGSMQWVPVVGQFYGPFSKDLDHATEFAGKVKLSVEQLDEACPLCKSPLVVRTGRYGKFVACSTFPKCKFTRQYGETVANLVCPKCGSPIVVKKSRKGKVFYGCSSYPSCTFAAWKKEDIK